MATLAARRAILALAVALAAVLGLLLPSDAAQAAPGTAAEAAQLVAARAHDLEALTEEFNEARETLEAQTRAAQEAAATLEKARAELATAQERVRGIARAAYTGEGQGSLRAFMTSASADDLVDRVATLQTIAGHQNAILGSAARPTWPPPRRRRTRCGRPPRRRSSSTRSPPSRPTCSRRSRSTRRRSAAQCPGAGGGGRRRPRGGGRTRASRADRVEAAPVASGPVVANSQAAQIAVDTAMAQRGKPYVWAASGPGSFDCSGLVQYAYAAAGIDLPHSSRLQAGWGGRSRGTSFSPVTWSPSTARSATSASTSATARWCTRPPRATS